MQGMRQKNSPSFKLSSPSRKDIVSWVHSGHAFLKNDNAMVQCSFEVCWHNHNKSKVGWQWWLLKRIMTNVEVGSDQTDDDADDDNGDEMFKDLFEN